MPVERARRGGRWADGCHGRGGCRRFRDLRDGRVLRRDLRDGTLDEVRREAGLGRDRCAVAARQELGLLGARSPRDRGERAGAAGWRVVHDRFCRSTRCYWARVWNVFSCVWAWLRLDFLNYHTRSQDSARGRSVGVPDSLPLYRNGAAGGMAGWPTLGGKSRFP